MMQASRVDRNTIFFYIGLALIALKLLTFLAHEIHIGGRPLDVASGHNFHILSWRLGKIAPTLFCASFLIDAIILKRRTIVLWFILMIGAAALTVYVVDFWRQ